MAEFESWKQYSEFSQFVRRKARHVLDARNQRFLDTVLETSAKRKGRIDKSAVLWRAQLGSEWRSVERTRDDEHQHTDDYGAWHPFPRERMTPLPDRACEGRVNPKGIPCLYLSTEEETAMAETRPWIGSYVSLAQFETLKDLSIVDCSADSAGGVPYSFDEPEPGKRAELIWKRINLAFSEPVTRSDDEAEYAPTQVLAEAFRNAGYEGIMYGSKLGVGKNIAIFDLTAAKLVNCHLYKVDSVSLKFSMAGSPYFIGPTG